MVRYLLRRAGLSLLTLYLFVTLLFFLAQVLIPGDFATQFRIGLSDVHFRELRQELAIDRPLWQQYLDWVGNLVRGDLGTAFSGRVDTTGREPRVLPGTPVTAFLANVLPNSLFAFVLAVGAAFLVGSWLGRSSAWRKGWARLLTTATSVGFYTSFPPWLAFVTAYLLVRLLGPDGYDDLRLVDPRLTRESGITLDIPFSLVGTRLLWFMLLTVVTAFLTLPLLSRAWRFNSSRRLPLPMALAWVGLVPVGIWLAVGVGPQALDLAGAQLVPILLFFVLFFGEVVVLTQAAMTAVEREDYIFTARAKGLPDREVRDRHAARPALLPVLSRFVVSLPYFLVGMVILERALGYPGIGSLLFSSLGQQDMPVVMGCLLVIGLITLAARMTLDVLHALLDPRIRAATLQEARL